MNTASEGTPESEQTSTDPPLPAFLRQTKAGRLSCKNLDRKQGHLWLTGRAEIHNKFVDLEWQQRNRLAQGLQTTEPASQWARVSGEDVLKRNRYLNVDPFLNNRIKLKVPEGHSDYINASPIMLRSTKSGKLKKFVATQGPKEGYHSHIYRMIWQETSSPAVIVMLTQTHESGKEKCFQYFPQSLEEPALPINEDDEFVDGFTATVTLLSLTEDPVTRSSIRELEIKIGTGETKKIWHLLFAGWPDFLVPEGEDKAALLQLVSLSAAKNSQISPSEESPRIVHCSAGVGRSGTFIALDWLLGELAEGSLDDVQALGEHDPIAEVVDTLRQQRMMMVQGEQQFWFLYDVLRECWIERWRKRHGVASEVAEARTEENVQKL